MQCMYDCMCVRFSAYTVFKKRLIIKTYYTATLLQAQMVTSQNDTVAGFDTWTSSLATYCR